LFLLLSPNTYTSIHGFLKLNALLACDHYSVMMWSSIYANKQQLWYHRKMLGLCFWFWYSSSKALKISWVMWMKGNSIVPMRWLLVAPKWPQDREWLPETLSLGKKLGTFGPSSKFPRRERKTEDWINYHRHVSLNHICGMKSA
jgi:hypothetical protein